MRFITVDEYLMGRAKLMELSQELVGNVNTIVPAANQLLEKFGEFRGVRSGYRTAEINAKTKGAAVNSRHMTCQAIDLADDSRTLGKWCLANLNILEDLTLYLEHPDYTPTWCHIQCVPPKSGKRVFVP